METQQNSPPLEQSFQSETESKPAASDMFSGLGSVFSVLQEGRRTWSYLLHRICPAAQAPHEWSCPCPANAVLCWRACPFHPLSRFWKSLTDLFPGPWRPVDHWHLWINIWHFGHSWVILKLHNVIVAIFLKYDFWSHELGCLTHSTATEQFWVSDVRVLLKLLPLFQCILWWLEILRHPYLLTDLASNLKLF